VNEWWPYFVEFVTSDRVLSLIRAIFLVVLGLVVAKLTSIMLTRFTNKHLDTHQSMLIRRGSYYLLLGIFVVSAMKELGFNLSVLLGAAGILTVAIGFASQTSASNLISGLFLVVERPFTIGDVVRVGSTVGEILSIDLLSIKLRTFDNLYVRIPNESIIKSELTNLTRFPIRRIDLQLGVAYKETLSVVREILFDVADKNPLCLEEPKSLFIFKGFGESSLDIQFSIWVKRENFLELRNSISEEIKTAFDSNNIEIPFPHRTLYTGSATEAFPINIQDSQSAQSSK